MALKKLKKLKYSSIYPKSSSSTSSVNSLNRQASNLKTRLEASGVSTDSRNALQKALNLREGSGFLEGLGDVLERASGLASIKAMIAGDPLKSAGENALDAFLGKQRYTGTDVIRTFNPDIDNASGIEKFLGGMAIDILLDPATYLSLGASAVAKNATTAGVKALGSADDVARILKTTKTADQATDVIKGTKAISGVKRATRAEDLLSASKLYRTADTLDTIANPLKLVPVGVKKAGGAAMKGIDKINPELGEGLRKLGGEFTKTFNYGNWLRKNLGDDVYKHIKLSESVSDASLAATSAKASEQYKLLRKVLSDIKKDPDRAWTTISKIDGHKEVVYFTGLTSDEIMSRLYDYATNQVYFSRPTVLNEDSIKLLIKNKGHIKLAAQDFADPKDLKSFKKALENIVDDPDLVSVRRYVQPETGIEKGWVVEIGESNAKTLSKNIDEIRKSIKLQDDLVVKRTAQKEAVTQRYKDLEGKLGTNKTRQTQISDELEALRAAYLKQTNPIKKQYDNVTKELNKLYSKYGGESKFYEIYPEDDAVKALDLNQQANTLSEELKNAIDSYRKSTTPLNTELNNLKKTSGLLQSNLSRMEKTSIAKSNDLLELAAQEAARLSGKQSLIDDLFKTRELVPFEAPILDVPEMQKIADIQRELVDTNLGIRNLGGMSVGQMDIYNNYIHRKLTDTSKAYIQTTKAKNDPTLSFLIGATDKLPAQAAMSNVYGNFSATEVNTMMGFDLFDHNIVSANLDMVNKLNRRSYNTQLTKALFTEPNEWVKNTRGLTDMEKVVLREQGFEPISTREIASKLKLSEILNEDDIAQITRGLKGQEFYMSKDVVELFDKNAKLYKQLDSQFYQQLNKYMKYWKGGNLLSVGYHLRNIVGAQTNMALAGMGLDDVAKYSAQAGLDITKYNTKLLPEFRKWILNPDNAAIFKTGTLDDVTEAFAKQVGAKDAKTFTELLDAQMKGAWGGIVGQHDAVKRAIGEMPKSKLGQVADKVQDVNYKLGATADDINRLAAYRWAQNPKNLAQVTKVGAQDALDFVNYAMFDFKSMSPTEQAYFTKLFPFYNFIKNNLTFQFKNMTKNAQRYNTLSKAYKNLYSAQELTDADVQQYVKDQLYIPIRQSDGSIKVLKVAPPVQDATNLLSLKNILGASNPLIQYITDRAYGEDLYTGADLGGDRTKNTQELVDLLPYGRSIRTTLNNPLGILLPVSSTTVEKGRNQNAYAELERLEKLRKQYKQQTGQSLPTLEELGLK